MIRGQFGKNGQLITEGIWSKKIRIVLMSECDMSFINFNYYVRV